MTPKKNTFLTTIKQSFKNENVDFTVIPIPKAVALLAIPMVFEMFMESLFAVVDTFFVSKLGNNALNIVSFTEGLLTIIYSIAIGLSMAVTAIVARRVGEKNHKAASFAAAQAIIVGIMISIILSIVGILFAAQLLSLLGATAQTINYGLPYTQIVLGSNIVIMLLFLINGIFRGAGNPSLAFRSLLIANICNIIFCPIFIHQFGIIGAALATLCGRSIGVIYQLFQLNKKQGILQLHFSQYFPNIKQIKAILNLSYTATLQFIIASGSWIFLNRLMSNYGEDAVAGYFIAIRILIFFLMPAWGISNAAATMVGQNLGANKPERAEQSVWQTAKINAIFMGCITLICFVAGEQIIRIFTNNEAIIPTAKRALQIISIGYIVYGIGMVILNSFNGAGDSKTPTIVNFFGYWCLQIPLAWLFSTKFNFGINGIFYCIIIIEFLVMLCSLYLFKKGKWKTTKV